MSQTDFVLAIFKRYDANGDGCISKKELGKILEKIDRESSDIASVVDHIDTNGDGKIQLEEFMDWILGDSADARHKHLILEGYAQVTQEKLEKHHRLEMDSDGRLLGEAEIEALETTASESLDELASLEKPPKGALAIMIAVHCLSGRTTHKVTWAESQKLLSKKQKFLDSLRNFEPEKVGHHILQQLQESMRTKYFDYDTMAPQSLASALLAKWAIGAVTRVKCSGGTKEIWKSATQAEAALKEHDEKTGLA
eukprot:CAMPEP_0197665174 /NCGR_PEP_ID=MMETSP1338-20131121/59073_1 /TAXON_ID=43686 ORGANISM="Pelagodinium beii, Strain RCC1491" /NCGR_SAMPLE_ID=MMETSP1338 /ASSEMBLY_ACC=CAM_ASM_000754 /LENGTH=252 /DNA_ID=CAMNT_0043243941 /DNA_START=45 /DNA_END=803 /DNA_ORIENTATION=-